MEVNKNELYFEKERLQKIYNLITDAIGTRDISAQDTKREIVSMRRSFWDAIVNSNEEIENVIEIAQRINQMDQEQYKYESKKQEINKLLRLKASPYFGRVDFTEKYEDFDENVYIGISSFINFETGEIYIYDWRSPISSIFYEFEKGPAQYNSPMGKIQGTISLKRQFKIHENIIDYMFDSNIKIDDEILQEILSKSADDKMKNIVTTIQKEQNRIIRDDKNRLVIVQGAAGSGKTSIALHRVAYLLYRYRDRAVSSNNIVIFSPNQMFNDYISNVLPELGEENINQTTFFE
jgi:DNA helicase-2/ATP-dependent DNA helicase PcrA